MLRSVGLFVILSYLVTSPIPAQTLIGSNFTGSTFMVDSSFRVPDTMGAAGIDHYVELINERFSVYRKNDGVRVQTSTLNQFWNNAGQTPSGANGAFDPRVVFDPHAHRWYAVAVDNGTNANNYLFAISSSSDPTQSWTAFKIDSDTDNSNWADFPMIGYNPEAVFLSANMPPLTAPLQRMSFIVLPKSSLLQPLPTIAGMTLLEDVPRPVGTNALSPQLAVDASNAIGINATLPIVMHDFTNGTLYRGEIVSPGSPSIVNVGTIGVAAAANPPTVDQPGPKQNLESNDGRLSANSVLYNGQIYATHSIDNGGLATVRFMRIDAATNAVLESQTIIDPVGRALTFPSVAVNDFGDVVIGVTGTSATEFASSYAMVGKTTAGGVTNFAAPLLLKAGVSDYINLDALNRNRWGDYSSTTVDPADPAIFWTNQEYVSSTDRWSTQVTELVVLQPNEARWSDAASGPFDDATRWQTAHGGAPISTDHLVFSRATNLSGVSTTVTLPPQPVGVYAYQSLSVRQGDVRLDLAGNQLDLALQLEVGPYYAQPRLTIANGSVNSAVGGVAPRPTSEGQLILDNTHWTASAVIVGSAPTPSAGCCLPGATGGRGTLSITNNSQLTVLSTLTIHGHAAVNLISGTLTADTIREFAPPLPGGVGFGLNFTGGTLHVNRFDGVLINSGGRLTPGGSAAGMTDVNFAYSQLAGSVLDIDIVGTGPGQFDRLIVGGNADFNGSLDVATIAGFAPALSNTFSIVQAGTIPNSSYALLLANTTFPPITNKLRWQLFYQPTALTLAVVPALSGDFNGNGIVDAADYVVWRKLQGQSGIGLPADGNFDQQVNVADLAIWRSQFGQFVPGSGAGADLPGGSAVPEPTAGALFMAFLSIAIGKRRRGPFRYGCMQ